VEIQRGSDAIVVRVEPPESWKGLGLSLDAAAIAVRVPREWASVSLVTVARGNEAPVTVPSWRWFWAGPRLLVVPFDLHSPLRIRVNGG